MCVRRFATHRPLLGARVHPSAWLTWQRRLGLDSQGSIHARGNRGGAAAGTYHEEFGVRSVHVLLVKKNSKSKASGRKNKNPWPFVFFFAFGPPAAWSA